MAVSKGEKITSEQINALISKLNSECSRRGVSGISGVNKYDPISFSKMDEINMKRIEVSRKYRAGYSDIGKCNERSDGQGTPASWDGRDLKEYRLNEREDKLSIGGKAHASQYNLLLEDIEALNAMCDCNAYKRTGCFPVCSCNDECSEKEVISDCHCDSVSYCACDSQCSVNRSSCGCEGVGCDDCNCVTTCYCDDHCGCDSGDCGCDGHCNDKPCDEDSTICTSEHVICPNDSLCGCDGD